MSLGFRLQGLGFRVLGFRVLFLGSGFRVWGFGLWSSISLWATTAEGWLDWRYAKSMTVVVLRLAYGPTGSCPYTFNGAPGFGFVRNKDIHTSSAIAFGGD